MVQPKPSPAATITAGATSLVPSPFLRWTRTAARNTALKADTAQNTYATHCGVRPNQPQSSAQNASPIASTANTVAGRFRRVLGCLAVAGATAGAACAGGMGSQRAPSHHHLPSAEACPEPAAVAGPTAGAACAGGMGSQRAPSHHHLPSAEACPEPAAVTAAGCAAVAAFRSWPQAAQKRASAA